MLTSHSSRQINIRSPDPIIPLNYKLQLQPNFQSGEASGDVTIAIDVKEKLQKIELDGVKIKITEVSLSNAKKKAFQIVPSEAKKEKRILFNLPEGVNPDKYELKIHFKILINTEKIEGFFSTKYFLEEGQEIKSAGFNLPPNNAKCCFPCFNDPFFRTSFELSVVAPNDYIPISNMPIKKTSTKQGLVTYEFEATPPMCCYSLGLIMGTFEFIESKSKDEQTLIRIYTYKKHKNDGLYALNLVKDSLEFFSSYFNFPYALPKLDYVPLDVIDTHVVSWGLVLAPAEELLISKDSNLKYLKKVALPVVHALVGQWFGNAFSMHYYEDFWIWNALTSFLKYIGLSRLYPSYGMWVDFVSKQDRNLIIDSFQDLNSTDQTSIDDKSTDLFNMLYHYIEDEKFQKALTTYGEKYKNTGSTLGEFWRVMEEVCRMPVSRIMKSFTSQSGLPVLFAAMRPKNDYFVLSITQRKFIKDGHLKGKGPLWRLPVTVFHCDEGITKIAGFILDAEGGEIIIPNNEVSGCIIIHPGYFRTSYSKYMLRQMHYFIIKQSLPVMDRLVILFDLFEIVQKGYSNTVELLELVRCFENETEYKIWQAICNILSILNVFLHHFPEDVKENFAMFNATLMNKIYTHLGWDEKANETDGDKLLRSLILGHLTKFDNTDITNKALQKFMQQWPKVPLSILYPVYRVVVREREMEVYHLFLQLYETSTCNDEKATLCKALAASENIEFIKIVLQFAISPQCCTKHGLIIMSHVITNSKLGNIASWGFIKEKYEDIEHKFGVNNMWILINALEVNITTEEMGYDIKSFFFDSPSPEMKMHINRVAQTAIVRAAWFRRDFNSILTYFREEFECTAMKSSSFN